MASGMNQEFAEMLSELSGAGADFLIVGAHALAAHGLPRATGDLDVWIRPTPENAGRVWQALANFGAPLEDLSVEELSTPGIVFQIGVPPARIDILTAITDVTFEQAWSEREHFTIDGVRLPFLSRRHLIQNKRATGRSKDISDVEELEKEL
jgi:hypothetical protein